MYFVFHVIRARYGFYEPLVCFGTGFPAPHRELVRLLDVGRCASLTRLPYFALWGGSCHHSTAIVSHKDMLYDTLPAWVLGDKQMSLVDFILNKHV